MFAVHSLEGWLINMSNPYKTRAGGATVTVFVPYDCNNHCPFCINKQEYEDCTASAWRRSCAVSARWTKSRPRATSSSPAASRWPTSMPCSRCWTHPAYAQDLYQHDLPVQQQHSAEEMIAFTEKNKDKITCMNISRHLVKYVEESPDEVIGRIACRTRINCVLYKHYPADKLPAYVERFLPYGIPIQFRYDYTATTPENLYDEKDDRILADLRRMFTYKGLDGCRMRNGFHFEYKGLHLTYHKTLPYSTIVETGEDGVTYDILYDILIKQNGDIHSDWTGVMLDVEKYRHVTFEPYDLRVLNGTIDF